MSKATLTNGIATYTGFEKNDNGKTFVEEKNDYIYISYQANEWTQYLVPILILTKENINEKRKYFLNDISLKNYADINEGKTLYRITLFCDNSLAEKVFYDKDEAINSVLLNFKETNDNEY